MNKPVLIAAGLIAALGAGYYAVSGSGTARAQQAQPVAKVDWVVAAPGRIEPKSGEIRIGTAVIGRVTEVEVKVNDKVEDGELLIRLDDDEARARLAAAEAEAGARRRERAAAPAQAGREDVTKAEDAVYAAERVVTGARYELDFAIAAKRRGNGGDSAVADAKRRLAEAKDRFSKEKLAYATAQAKPNLPAPTQYESALTVARANVTMADALLEKTRLRSAESGTVLQLLAKLGEMVAPGTEPLAVIGDMSIVRVKAEVDDGDIAKLKVGQKAFVKSLNYPGREFNGRISSLASTLASPRIGGRGPRRLTDVEVLEVTIDLDGTTPLLPGMRVDTFVRRE